MLSAASKTRGHRSEGVHLDHEGIQVHLANPAFAVGGGIRRRASPGWSNVEILLKLEPSIAKCFGAPHTGLQSFYKKGASEVNGKLLNINREERDKLYSTSDAWFKVTGI